MSARTSRGERKAQLAEAVWRIIVLRGIGAVSVRSVAEEAGVVVGSLRHLFPTRAELLQFSAELMEQRARQRIAGIVRSQDAQQFALEVLLQLLPLEPDSRAELEVNIALIAEAPALPELKVIRDRAHHELAEVCAHMVELLTGRPRDSQGVQQAQRLHAILDGLAIHLFMSPSPEKPEWAVDIVRDEIGRLTTEP